MNKPQLIDIEAGQILRKIRRAQNMSQEKLADQLGITFQQVQKYENGSNRIGFSRLISICKVLGVSLSTFEMGTKNTNLPYIPSSQLAEHCKMLEEMPADLKNKIIGITSTMHTNLQGHTL